MLSTAACGGGQNCSHIMNWDHWIIVSLLILSKKKKFASIHTTIQKLKAQASKDQINLHIMYYFLIIVISVLE